MIMGVGFIDIWVYTISGLDWWTGLLGLTSELTKLKP